ncbi:hypothetical protein AB0H73_14825 [Streptomyces olivoreticuli]
MIHAVFNAARQPLAQFDDAEHPAGGQFLAEWALLTVYPDVSGAFVDGLCVAHQSPACDCGECADQMLCDDCDWPTRNCEDHGGNS